MARPIKNYCDYFSHDNDMRNNRKVRAIRNKFGISGYAIWCMILEYLTGIDGNEFEYSKLEFELMSGDFGVSASEIQDVIDYCISLDMLFNKYGFIISDSLDERLKPVYDKRDKLKEVSANRKRKSNGQFIEDNEESSGVSVEITPQSKVKETKEEESKVKEISLRLEKYEKFLSEVNAIRDSDPQKYSDDIINSFIEYWTKEYENGNKFKFEYEEKFVIKLRLSTFIKKRKPSKATGINKDMLDVFLRFYSEKYNTEYHYEESREADYLNKLEEYIKKDLEDKEFNMPVIEFWGLMLNNLPKFLTFITLKSLKENYNGIKTSIQKTGASKKSREQINADLEAEIAKRYPSDN